MRVITNSGGIRSQVNTNLAAGTIMTYGGSVAPYGWQICDGSAVSRTTYATLFGVIGTTYGVGDGSTTFNLPDLRTLGADTFDFRLTTLSGVAVTTSDRTSQGTLYLTPYSNGINGSVITANGNARLALYDGTRWNLYISGEISLSLSISNATVYDVFVYDNSGTLTLETIAWTDTTTRATALVLQDGILVKSGSLTHRYVGSICGTGSNITEDSAANRFVVNYYNRAWKNCECLDATQDYIFTLGTYVQIGSNQISYLNCVGDYIVRVEGFGAVYIITGVVYLSIGTTPTTQATKAVPGVLDESSNNVYVSVMATLCETPGIGLVTRYLIARVNASTAEIWGNLQGTGTDNAQLGIRAMVQC